MESLALLLHAEQGFCISRYMTYFLVISSSGVLSLNFLMLLQAGWRFAEILPRTVACVLNAWLAAQPRDWQKFCCYNGASKACSPHVDPCLSSYRSRVRTFCAALFKTMGCLKPLFSNVGATAVACKGSNMARTQDFLHQCCWRRLPALSAVAVMFGPLPWT